MDGKHITFDDRKKNALDLTIEKKTHWIWRWEEEEEEGGEGVRIKVIRTRVYLKAAAED